MSEGQPDPSASGAVDKDALKVGDLFDRRYRIVKKLGEGGMGEVYAAEHTTLQKRVAIKLLRPEIVSNVEAVKRFRQEATSSSSIGHKNIIRIEDFADLPDGRIYLCMELLDGLPLNDMIKEQAMSPDRLLNIAIQTGHGLAAAHAKGIVHRDMKPENIFVTTINGEDVPKILDFGIAKVAGNDGQNNLTRTGTIFGTPFYMAPEQAMGQHVDGRVDVYAMGVILYEVFAGSLPFRGDSFMGILTQHITTEPEPVAQRAAQAGRALPPGLAEVIQRAMAKDPAQRYASMDELVQALVAVYRTVAGSGMSQYMEAYQPPQSRMMPAAGTGGHAAPQSAPTMGLGMIGGPGPGAPSQPYAAPHMTPPHMTPPPGQMPAGPPHMTPPPMSAPMNPGGSYAMGAADGSMVMPAKKSSAALVFVIIAVLAVVGGGVALFLISQNKKSDEQAANDPGTATGADPATATDPGTGTATATGADPATGTATGTATATGADPATGTGTGAATGTAAATGTDPGTGSQVETPIDAGVASAAPDASTQVALAPIVVLVDANADGARVFQDGKPLGKVPTNVKVTPGESITLILKRKGYKDTTVTVDGAQDKVHVKMDKERSGNGDGTGRATGTGTGTGTSEPEDPRKAFCRKNPDSPRCMVE